MDFTARNLAAACCAASAGVHAALVPEHLEENTILGIGFALAAVLLFASTLALVRRGALHPLTAPATVVLLVALICAYAVSRTTGLTPIGADVESVDALGVITQVVQVAGLAAALFVTTQGKESRTCVSLDT